MARISIELVPRDDRSFKCELEFVKEKFPGVDTLNIPDILKFDMRIPDACAIAAPYFKNVIPHIRAVSVDRNKPFRYAELFERLEIKETLVILGYNPENAGRSVNPCDSISLISKIKKETPDVKVYAGLDPYRSSMEEELDYAHRKSDAGADGFFTQPFFDLELMDKWMKKMPDSQVFWGLAPVVRESSRRYWENDNNVFFPDDFECSLTWNREFARKALRFMEETSSNVYFMPITVDLEDYLKGVIY
jgi:methylenetetrahydrofolate reductase (NADPH)